MLLFSLFLSGLTLVRCADILSVSSEQEKKLPDVRFFCMHSSVKTYSETSFNDKDLSKKLDFKLDFAFFVHGWQAKFSFDEKDSTPYKIGLEWVSVKKTNFCGVDWRELASDGYYDASKKHVKFVGLQVASFLMKLRERNVTMRSVTIAGHSLGAHVGGFAGKHIYELTETKISTIFGLDPAGPFFTSMLLLARSDFCLSKNDALFVQILHTASGTYGTSKMIGHADFIANGGEVQAACVDELLSIEDLLFTCSHSFAKEIFLASFTQSCSGVTETKTDGVVSLIKSWFSKDKGNVTDVYGIHNLGKYGVFELETSRIEPYCKKILQMYHPCENVPGMFRDDNKRVDDVTLIPWRNGQSMVWDATCSDTPSYPIRALVKQIKINCQADKAANFKLDKYKKLVEDNYIVIPFAIETLGV